MRNRNLRRVGASRALAFAASSIVCVTHTAGCTVSEERPRFGIGVGYRPAAVTLDRDNPEDDVDLGNGGGFGGFAEALLPGSDIDVHVRLLAQRTDIDVRGSAANAELTDYGALLLLSTQLRLGDGFGIRPLFGGGYGYFDLEGDGLIIGTAPTGSAGVFAAGAELEIASHLLIGALGQIAIFGEPGNTEGEVESALLYVGVRF
jgi:hypothetical protein